MPSSARLLGGLDLGNVYPSAARRRRKPSKLDDLCRSDYGRVGDFKRDRFDDHLVRLPAKPQFETREMISAKIIILHQHANSG